MPPEIVFHVFILPTFLTFKMASILAEFTQAPSAGLHLACYPDGLLMSSRNFLCVSINIQTLPCLALREKCF